jgi:hypothetical protein
VVVAVHSQPQVSSVQSGRLDSHAATPSLTAALTWPSVAQMVLIIVIVLASQIPVQEQFQFTRPPPLSLPQETPSTSIAVVKETIRKKFFIVGPF